MEFQTNFSICNLFILILNRIYIFKHDIFHQRRLEFFIVCFYEYFFHKLQSYNVMKKNDQKQNRKRLNSQSALQKLPPLNKKQNINDKPSLPHITHQDQGIIGLLYEYFIKNNFMDTLDTFQKDCHQKGFKPNNKFMQSFRQEILQAFQQGNRQVFISRFNQYVPISMRNKDPQTMKLQFYLHVYFFIYSIHPQLGKKRTIDASAKQSFVSYLQGKGSALAKSQEFLQFYALAYLQKPQENPSFKTIFTREWIGQLKKQLIYFIEKLYPVGKTPVIINIYDKFIERNMEKGSQHGQTQPDDQFEIQQLIEPEQSQIMQNNQISSRAQQTGPKYQSLKSPNAFDVADRQKQSMNLKIAELEEQKNQLFKFIQNVKKKYQSLQNNYKDFTDAAQNTLMQSQSKWFKITQEFYNMASNLRDVCAKLQNNQPLEDPTVVDKISKKLSKYQSFVKMNIQDLISQNVDFSLFQKPNHDQSVDMIRKSNDERPQFYIQLDFEKIKAVLSRQGPQNDKQKSFLLQALKQRITKTRGALLKRQIVLSIVLNDIFNLKKGDQIIKALIMTQNQTLLTKVMQFFNALAKDYFGRNYLSCQSVVKNILTLLKSQSISQYIVVVAVSFLQQLSVRKNAQKVMIQGQMIKWIVTKLRNQRQTMSKYLMQYSLAIMINLLLKKQGLQKSQQIKEQVLKTLIDLMEIQTIQIRQYVHGAIYPLFHKKVFRQKAKEYGLQANIKFLLQNTQSEHLINQLNYLQKQLMREDEEKQQQNEDNEQQYDFDEINDEELGQDFDYEVDQEAGGQMTGLDLTGEQLLMKMYPLTGPDAIRQINMIRQQAEITLKNKSVYVASNYSERPSTNNPKLGMRRNISNNNSVYSNKSSNRILKSQLMNRSQLNKNQPREKLDTVHPDNSQKQMSVKDFIQDQSQFIKIPSQRQSRKKQHSELYSKGQPRNQRTSQPNILDNGSFKNPGNQLQNASKAQRSLKPYQNSQQYRQVFIARSQLVRTPPQK